MLAKAAKRVEDTKTPTRGGDRSAADLIAATAEAVGNDPAVERELLDAAGQGMVPLRDKCIEVRARSEDQSERTTRLHAGRSFRKWTNAEGMCEGHFKAISTVAHFGRSIPAELRTAMILGGRECAVFGCSRRDYLELDHCEVDYAKNAPTALWNLAWLCPTRHSRKWKGWRLGPTDPATGKRPLVPPTVLAV